jgi:hypothetical protein
MEVETNEATVATEAETTTAAATPAPDKTDLKTTATEFSRNIEEAAGRMGSAAEQFLSMTTSFLVAGDRLQAALDGHRQIEAESQAWAKEAVSAASDAADALKQAQAAQRAAEDVLARMQGDYGELTALVTDLRERIAALAVLAQPLPEKAEEKAPAGSPDLVVVQGRTSWDDQRSATG